MLHLILMIHSGAMREQEQSYLREHILTCPLRDRSCHTLTAIYPLTAMSVRAPQREREWASAILQTRTKTHTNTSMKSDSIFYCLIDSAGWVDALGGRRGEGRRESVTLAQAEVSAPCSINICASSRSPFSTE